MATEQDENTLLENSNNIFFEDVEGEQGKSLNLEEDQKLTLVGTIQKRFTDAETARTSNAVSYTHLRAPRLRRIALGRLSG